MCSLLLDECCDECLVRILRAGVESASSGLIGWAWQAAGTTHCMLQFVVSHAALALDEHQCMRVTLYPFTTRLYHAYLLLHTCSPYYYQRQFKPSAPMAYVHAHHVSRFKIPRRLHPQQARNALALGFSSATPNAHTHGTRTSSFSLSFNTW